MIIKQYTLALIGAISVIFITSNSPVLASSCWQKSTAWIPSKHIIAPIIGCIAASVIDNSCAMGLLFGRHDVREDIACLFYTVFAEVNCNSNQCIQVKKMNSLTAKNYISFSWPTTPFATIWINEEVFDQLSPEEQLFIVYHEIAHIMAGHPTKNVLLGILAISVDAILGGVAANVSELETVRAAIPNNIVRLILAMGAATVCSTTFATQWLLPKMKSYEQEADLNAARLLCQTGKSDILRAYIHSLKNRAQQSNSALYSPWSRPGLCEQIEYLSTCLQAYTA